MARPAANPGQLQIAGLQPLSTVDWPGKLAAVLFLQGCPWHCPYCHNFEILDPRTPGAVTWKEVQALLSRRRGLLDGVVFSGGEATRQPALLDAAREVRAAGFLVGLHTAGAYPAGLRRLLQEGAADWVGLDIKASPEDYSRAAGAPTAAAKAAASLRVLLDAAADQKVEYEVRFTHWEGGVDKVLEVAKWCRKEGVEHFVLQRLQQQNLPPGFHADPQTQTWRVEEAEALLAEVGFTSVQVRS